jgi:hypothetical protein
MQKQSIPKLEFDQELLREIKNKCLPPDTKITIDYNTRYFFQEQQNPLHEVIFYMNLRKNNKIVSNLELVFREDANVRFHQGVIIRSETQQQYRRLHYNTILRCVLVMLIPSMEIEEKKIDKIISEAEQFLSVYSLTKLGFIAEKFEGFPQQFDLSFYSPQQQNQQQRISKQKTLKQFIRSKFQQRQDPEPTEVLMVLPRKDYQKSSRLAKRILDRFCNEHPTGTKKRKHEDQEKQKQKK